MTAETLFIGLTSTDILKILIGFIIAIFLYFLKSHYDIKRERFFNGEQLTVDELDLMENPDRRQELTLKTADQKRRLRQSYTLHHELADIRCKKWSEHYLHTLNQFLIFISRLLSEKTRVSHLASGKSQWINPRAFTLHSYEFCLKIAIIYPLLLSIISWLISGELIIADFTLISQDAFNSLIQVYWGLFMIIVGFWRLAANQGRWLVFRLLMIFLGVFTIITSIKDPSHTNIMVAMATILTMAGFLVGIKAIRAVSIVACILTLMILVYFFVYNVLNNDLKMAILAIFILSMLSFILFLVLSAFVSAGAIAKMITSMMATGRAAVIAIVSAVFSGGAIAAVLIIAAVIAGSSDTDMAANDSDLTNLELLYSIVEFSFTVIALMTTYSVIVGMSAGITSRFYPKQQAGKLAFWVSFNITGIVFSVICILLVLVFGSKENAALLLFPIFLGILPLLNAGVDWLSLNITRSFLTHIYQKHDNWRSIAMLSVADLVLSLFFIFFITTLLLLTLSGINNLSWLIVGEVAWNFGPLMADLRDPGKFAELFWVYAMVLSTLVPTLLHLFFALYATALWPKIGWHKAFSESFWVDEKSRAAMLRCHNFSSMLAAILVLVTGGLLYIIGSKLGIIGSQLWAYADWLLRLIDPTYTLAAF